MVPGQRIVETDLAAQYGVGRNAVREAVQWLSAHGVIDPTRHRSASIRLLDAPEALEVLDVAEPLIGLAARAAAAGCRAEVHGALLADALAELGPAQDAAFSRARRLFYRALIEIGDNRALRRIFPALGLHIFYAQYRGAVAIDAQRSEFRELADAIRNGDTKRAEALGRAHISALRKAVG